MVLGWGEILVVVGHRRGVVIAIVRRWASYDFSKSVDPDESYGNAIVLTILKDVINNVYPSLGTCADVITRC